MKRVRLAALWVTSAIAVMAAESAPVSPPNGAIDLATALRLAGANSLDVQVAREKVAEAEALRDSARAKYFPWITPAVVVRRHENNTQAVAGPIIDADKQSLAAGIALSAQIELGETYYQNLAAKQLVRSHEAALAGRQRETTLRAASAYFDLARARLSFSAAEDAARITRRHAEQIAAMVEAGLTFQGDAARVVGARERADLTVERLRAEQRIAAARLSEILRLDPTVELTPVDAELAPLALVPAGTELGVLVTTALAKRPELDESAAPLEIARTSSRGAKVAPLIPTLGAQAVFGGLGGGPSGSTVTRDFDSSTDYALGLSWRVGPGGLFDQNRKRETASRERQVELELEKTRDLIRRQVVEQHTRYRSLATQIEIARKALDAADQTARLSRQRRETGVGVVLEDLQAEEELSRARRDYVATVADYNLAQYALRFATGE